MCGRFALTVEPATLQEAFPEFAIPDNLSPRYNIAPTQDVAVVANNGENRVELFRWGLIPSWAKDPGIGNRMINARAESLSEKPAFRNAYKRRRCLVLTDGFYEWWKEPGSKTKTPVYIRLKSGQPFTFAGLWERWGPEGEEPILSCTIITTTPNELLEKIHNRMPVILPTEAYAQWLDAGEQTPDQLDEWLKPYPAAEMTAYAVSRLVNNPRNDAPACVEPSGQVDF